jgi:hypothetical protein
MALDMKELTDQYELQARSAIHLACVYFGISQTKINVSRIASIATSVHSKANDSIVADIFFAASMWRDLYENN